MIEILVSKVAPDIIARNYLIRRTNDEKKHRKSKKKPSTTKKKNALSS